MSAGTAPTAVDQYVTVARGRCKGFSGIVRRISERAALVDDGDRQRWIALDRLVLL